MTAIKFSSSLVTKQLVSGMRISRGGFSQRKHLLIKATSENGLSGFGEAIGDAPRIHGFVHSEVMKTEIESFLRRESFIDPEKLTRRDVYLEGVGTVRSAFAGIETSILDLVARTREIPLSRLFFEETRTRLKTYVSSIYWNSASKMITEALQAIDRGANCIKVHLGVDTVAEEYERVARIADAISDKSSLIVDLNCAYSTEEIESLIDLWSDIELDWLEEPLRPSCLAALPDVCESSPWPVAVGENLGRFEEFDRAIRDGVGVLMPDIGRIGYLAAEQIAELSAKENRVFSPHNYGSGVLLAATSQLLSGVEKPGPLELDFSANSLYSEVFGEIVLENGFLRIDESSGIGLGESGYSFLEEKLDWEEFASVQVEEGFLCPTQSLL